eukprot:Clim_evm19s202 gene=Clim_evmTU19s202
MEVPGSYGYDQVPNGQTASFGAESDVPSLSPKGLRKIIAYASTDGQQKSTFKLFVVSSVTAAMMLFLASYTHSLTLSAYAAHLSYVPLAAISSMVAAYAEVNQLSQLKSHSSSRFEVMAVFTANVVVIFGLVNVIKEGVEHSLTHVEHKEVHATPVWVLGLVAVGLIADSLGTRFVQANTNAYISSGRASYNFKYTLASMVQATLGAGKLYYYIVARRPMSYHRIASFACGLIACFGTFIQVYYPEAAMDKQLGLILGFLSVSILWPIAYHISFILMETAPSDLVSQLDKSLRECLTLDGVLEFTDEKFWSTGFNEVAGYIHVRIRRDANEQVVLTHIHQKLSQFVSDLTVQVIKDDWGAGPAAMSPAPHLPQFDQGHGHAHNDHGHGHSHYNYGHAPGHGHGHAH